MQANSRTIVLSANSEWNIANFRVGLIRGLQNAGYVPLVIAPPHAAVEGRMRELGVERIAIRIDRSGLNPYADLQLLRRYRHLLKRIRPAAYLGFTIKPNIYGSLAAGSLGIPSIPNVSGLGTAFIRRGLLQQIVTLLYRIGFRRVPFVFFQNKEDCELFVDRRMVTRIQARVLPGSGVDLDRFRPAELSNAPAVFLFIGRLLRDKGVIEFVESARHLRASLPQLRFQLLGPIDEENRTSVLSSELRNWEKEGIIEYLGVSDDVRPFIAAATAVVLPSYREGLPRSLLEAGAMGRPLIATDVPGCRDVVDDTLNGYLCKARDASSLGSAMEHFALLPHEQRLQMGKAARVKVQERFSEEVVIRGYLDVLAELN
ncbi:MAG TPA: glycosyltransferase family 4 protein [Sphingomicrobium sp.]|nr:glycosyltransferase family 4 protein [Sphingomicrobium sp.]